MFSMVQAGSMGLPFIAVRGLLGTDLLKERSDFQVISNPFHAGEETVITAPIRPDIAVFHALVADRWGNAVTPRLRDDLMMARAAHRVVVTAEQVLDRSLTLQDAVHHTFLPAIDVDALVHAPFGAHPCGCGDLYKADEAHLKEYIEAAKDEKSFQAYLKKYVYDLKNQGDYLGRVSLPTSTDGGNKR
jgi:glutaconate CoA-transferase subunit A